MIRAGDAGQPARGGRPTTRITDFNAAAAAIRLDNGVFGALGATGALADAKSHIGAHATTLAHRIIYDDATGALLYDANGGKAGGEVKFAVLAKGLALTEADFVII